MGLILLILLIVLLIGAFPTWNYSQEWGYRPVGIFGVLLLIVLILVLLNIITFWDIKVESTDNQTNIKIERTDQ